MMAKASTSSKFETKSGSDEFRLSNVDGRATVDVGQPAKFGNRLGPGWRSEKWGGRGWMSVSGHGVTLNRAGQLKTDAKCGEVYECECVRKVRGRNRAERHLILPGSTEYQIEWDTLSDVPDTGYVDLLLEFSGDLTWHKQPALTQEEIDGGALRPENVVNSYAVYGSQSGRILTPQGVERVNYETGKFCHLFRSCLIDSRGNRCWLDQTAPLANPNRLRVRLDTAWIADATFPVTLDPTFGYTSAGASSANAEYAYCLTAGTLAAAGGEEVTALTAYISENTKTLQAAVYSIVLGTPSAMLASPVTLTAGSSAAWKTALMSATLSAAIYGPAVGNGSQCKFYYDIVAGSSSRNLGGLTDPWVQNIVSAVKPSVYATYTEAAAGNPYYAYSQQ